MKTELDSPRQTGPRLRPIRARKQGHDAGAQERVEMLRATIGTLACRAARAKIFGSIRRDQNPATPRAAQAPERVEHALCGDRFEKQRIERPRRSAIQHLADIGVSWNGGHTS